MTVETYTTPSGLKLAVWNSQPYEEFAWEANRYFDWNGYTPPRFRAPIAERGDDMGSICITIPGATWPTMQPLPGDALAYHQARNKFYMVEAAYKDEQLAAIDAEQPPTEEPPEEEPPTEEPPTVPSLNAWPASSLGEIIAALNQSAITPQDAQAYLSDARGAAIAVREWRRTRARAALIETEADDLIAAGFMTGDQWRNFLLIDSSVDQDNEPATPDPPGVPDTHGQDND